MLESEFAFTYTLGHSDFRWYNQWDDSGYDVVLSRYTYNLLKTSHLQLSPVRILTGYIMLYNTSVISYINQVQHMQLSNHTILKVQNLHVLWY